MKSDKSRGRPPVADRPNTVTASIRYVNRDALRLLKRYALDRNVTTGEALSDLVFNSLK